MKNIWLILFIIAGCSGCGDFLEPKSKSEFVPREVSALNELLLREAYPISSLGRLWLYMDLLDDDIDCSLKYMELKQLQNRDPYYAVFTWQPNMYEIFEDNSLGDASYNIYRTYYGRIRGANAVLDYLETVSGTEEEITSVHAQALALRAFYYFQLVNIFGHPYSDDKEALGVPLKLTSGVVKELPARQTVGRVYEQILADLKEAEKLYLTLPENMQWKMNYRTSLPMVQLLLSRVYLYMEDWTQAAQYASKVMENTHFALMDLNLVNDFTKDGDIYYPEFHLYICSELIWPYGNVEDYTAWPLLQGKEGYNVFKASDALMATFDETPGDLRKSKYVVREKDSLDGVAVPQPLGKMTIATNYMRPQGGFLFARSFRLSEAYLNYIEANAMLYKNESNAVARTEALEALRLLRQNRIAADEDSEIEVGDADDLVRFVRNERRRELCFESFRWFDLRRWGMPEIKHIWHADEQTTMEYTLREKDPAYTLPLPPEALKNNTNLVQNPLANPRSN